MLCKNNEQRNAFYKYDKYNKYTQHYSEGYTMVYIVTSSLEFTSWQVGFEHKKRIYFYIL